MQQTEFDDQVLEAFLNQQARLFDEEVAETPEEADDFLTDCMAVVVDSISEVREYFEENMDAAGMSDDELRDALEVFPVGDGRYLIVEG